MIDDDTPQDDQSSIDDLNDLNDASLCRFIYCFYVIRLTIYDNFIYSTDLQFADYKRFTPIVTDFTLADIPYMSVLN